MSNLLSNVVWVEVERADVPDPDGLPYVTHMGEVVLMGQTLRCCQLSDGRRVLNADDVADFFAGVLAD